ncbi:ABC transporter ATP-binding protein [Falsiroseomonas sp. HW251]|uniref:ABC transporter ATP-binding protein n=1 Tax=Falsiroseomonas sp. HW251 TaxID=3390998 RepID=UPI003D3241FE
MTASGTTAEGRMELAGAQPVIAVRDLTVTLDTEAGPVPLLRGVSLDVMPSEVLGVVGESGAGKSMLGNAITGLLDRRVSVTGGAVLFRGRPIDGLRGEAMRRLRGRAIATVFQDPLTSLNPVFTIGRQLTETIGEHLGLSGATARAEAVSLLAQVGIPAPEARLSSYPHEFSGGMRQRVVIALALAGRPAILIADEPTTALDVSIQGQIIELLRDVCASRGTAMLLITHDMGVIAALATRVAVLYAGRVVEVGPVEEVLRRPRHPYTRGLMDSIPEIGRRLGRLHQIPGAMPRPDTLPPGCPYAPRCPRAAATCADAVPALQGHGPHQAACFLPLEASAAA